MPCTNCGGDTKTYIDNGDGITFTGSGTNNDPYVPHLQDGANLLNFQVRDSGTINFTLYGSGLPGDPLVLTGDTASAATLAGLGDVAANPAPSQGTVPMYIGTSGAGQFQMRTPGTRYTTNASRGSGTFQGEQIFETDTGNRYEWDGSQWVSLTQSSVAPSSLDPSVVQNKGTLDGTVDWNTLNAASGIYRINNGVNSNNNSPSGAYAYGTLEVLKSGNSVTQRYNTHSDNRLYWRTKFNDTDWTGWSSAALSADVQSEASVRASADTGLQNQLNSEAAIRAQQDNALSSATTSGDANLQNQVNGQQGQINARTTNLSNAAKITGGNTLVNNFSSTGYGGTSAYSGYADVTWPAFASISAITATAQSADTGGCSASVANISNSGCRITVVRRNNVATGVDWVVVGN